MKCETEFFEILYVRKNSVSHPEKCGKACGEEKAPSGCLRFSGAGAGAQHLRSLPLGGIQEMVAAVVERKNACVTKLLENGMKRPYRVRGLGVASLLKRVGEFVFSERTHPVDQLSQSFSLHINRPALCSLRARLRMEQMSLSHTSREPTAVDAAKRSRDVNWSCSRF